MSISTHSNKYCQTFYHAGFMYDYTKLAPKFFSRLMNITIDVLQNFFQIWLNAIHSIFNQTFTNHDALVGENACHVRAIVLLDIHFKIKSDIYFKNALENLINNIQWFIQESKLLTLNPEDQKLTIQEFLYKNNLLFCIDNNYFDDIKCIIDSYFLTITRQNLPANDFTLNEKTNYHHLNRFGLTKNKAKCIVACSQKSLSKFSCEYIAKEAENLGIDALKHLIEVKHDAHERSFMPQFIAGKILFRRALHKNYKIIVKIHRYYQSAPISKMVLHFKPNYKKSDFEFCHTMKHNEPCIILNGVVNHILNEESHNEYFTRILSHSLIEIIDANFASHPQYSGELKKLSPPFQTLKSVFQDQLNLFTDEQKDKKEILKIKSMIHDIEKESADFEEKKKFAMLHGCCLQNPSLLFLNHIYADISTNSIKTIQ